MVRISNSIRLPVMASDKHGGIIDTVLLIDACPQSQKTCGNTFQSRQALHEHRDIVGTFQTLDCGDARMMYEVEIDGAQYRMLHALGREHTEQELEIHETLSALVEGMEGTRCLDLKQGQVCVSLILLGSSAPGYMLELGELVNSKDCERMREALQSACKILKARRAFA